MAKVLLNLRKLSNKEFSRFMSSLLRDWQSVKATVDDPVLTKLKTRLSQQSDVLYQGLGEVKDSQMAKDIEAADKLRDQHLQLLAEMVKTGRLATVTEDKEAYQVIAPLFKDVSKIKRSNHEEASLSINTLLDQLKKTEFQAAIRTLNLSKAIYDNKQARQDLMETYTALNHYLAVMAKEATPIAYGKLYKVLVATEETFKPLTKDKKAKEKAGQASPERQPEPASEQV